MSKWHGCLTTSVTVQTVCDNFPGWPGELHKAYEPPIHPPTKHKSHKPTICSEHSVNKKLTKLYRNYLILGTISAISPIKSSCLGFPYELPSHRVFLYCCINKLAHSSSILLLILLHLHLHLHRTANLRVTAWDDFWSLLILWHHSPWAKPIYIERGLLFSESCSTMQPRLSIKTQQSICTKFLSAWIPSESHLNCPSLTLL